MVSLPSILVSPRSAFDFPCFLSGDVVLNQQAKGLRHSVLWYATSAEFHITITCHFPDLVSASAWLKQIFHAERPIRSITQIWVMLLHRRKSLPFCIYRTLIFEKKVCQDKGPTEVRADTNHRSVGSWESISCFKCILLFLWHFPDPLN